MYTCHYFTAKQACMGSEMRKHVWADKCARPHVEGLGFREEVPDDRPNRPWKNLMCGSCSANDFSNP